MMKTTLIELYPNQSQALELLRSGCILCGGVGSGKSITGLAYYFIKECEGVINDGYPIEMKKPKDLYIITTAKKRDTLDWVKECGRFLLVRDRNACIGKVKVIIDSWNNIQKYVGIKNAFFLFDEDKAIGYGSWAKAFIKIAQNNHWLMLTATPGDTWIEYVPVFIANGFYKNKTDFVRQHVIYNPRVNFPKVERYVNCGKLLKYKKSILVVLKHTSPARHEVTMCQCQYNRDQYKQVLKERWNFYTNEPLRNAAELCYTLRKIVNSDADRLDEVKRIITNCKTNKVIIFYSFDYELEMLRTLGEAFTDYTIAECNGHKHDDTPKASKWIYLVQYTAGCEAWNCIETNCIIFYSLEYSYKKMLQASGRIDRRNTPFPILYYYVLFSDSSIDQKILHGSLKEKRTFNEQEFVRETFAPKTTHIMEGEGEYVDHCFRTTQRKQISAKSDFKNKGTISGLYCFKK